MDPDPAKLWNLVQEHLNDSGLIIMCILFTNLCGGQLREKLGMRNTHMKHLLDVLFGPNDADEEMFIKKVSNFVLADASTIRAAFNKKFDPDPLQAKYKIGVKRQKLSEHQLLEMQHSWDKHIPWRSGKDHRILKGTKSDKYEKYRKECMYKVSLKSSRVFSLMFVALARLLPHLCPTVEGGVCLESFKT